MSATREHSRHSPGPAPSTPREEPRARTDAPAGRWAAGTPEQVALARTVMELEAHVARAGWDAPVGVFALVRTAAALEADPSVAELLDEQALAEAGADPHSLTVIEQENLPAAQDLEDLLTQLAWPGSVDGAAVSVERIMVPPEAQREAEALEDPQARLDLLASHPQRNDVRIVAGVLRSGTSWCAVRGRGQDDDANVLQGADLVPGLIEALAATLA